MTLIGMITSLALVLAMSLIALLDTLDLITVFASYFGGSLTERADLRLELVAQAVGIVDSFLISAVMLLFGLGLYVLFIGKLEVSDSSELARRILLVESLDDLKDKLGRMILLLLVVKFFHIAVTANCTGQCGANEYEPEEIHAAYVSKIIWQRRKEMSSDIRDTIRAINHIGFVPTTMSILSVQTC